MAALLAAEAGPRHLHPLEDVLVADGRPDDLAAGRLDAVWRPPFERTETTSAPSGSDAALEPVEGEDPEDLVAVDDLAGRVDRDQPVGVAVEGEPDVRAALPDRRGERCRARSPRTRR